MQRRHFLEPLEARNLLTHFRFGSITWDVDPVNTREVEFSIEQSWRANFSFYNYTQGSSTSSHSVGDEIRTERFYFGDGSSEFVRLKINSIDTTQNLLFGTATLPHTYATNQTYTGVGWSSCCRISTLGGGQNDDQYTVYATVDLGNSTSPNLPPVSTITPIVQVQDDTIASFQIPVIDPNDPPGSLSFSISTNSGLTPSSPPAPFSVANDGTVTWDIQNSGGANVSPGDLYAVQINVTDGVNVVPIDFLLNVVANTNDLPTVLANPSGPFNLTRRDGVYVIVRWIRRSRPSRLQYGDSHTWPNLHYRRQE